MMGVRCGSREGRWDVGVGGGVSDGVTCVREGVGGVRGSVGRGGECGSRGRVCSRVSGVARGGRCNTGRECETREVVHDTGARV